MRNRIFGFAGIAVFLVSVAILAVGHGFQGPGAHRRSGGRSHGDMMEHMSRALSLTDAQQQQVKAIMESMESTADGAHAKLEEIQKQLDTATANGQFDEAQVRSLASQKAQLEADMLVEHFRTKSKVYSILTAEQRAKADELHKRMGPHERRHGPPHPPGQ